MVPLLICKLLLRLTMSDNTQPEASQELNMRRCMGSGNPFLKVSCFTLGVALVFLAWSHVDTVALQAQDAPTVGDITPAHAEELVASIPIAHRMTGKSERGKSI